MRSQSRNRSTARRRRGGHRPDPRPSAPDYRLTAEARALCARFGFVADVPGPDQMVTVTGGQNDDGEWRGIRMRPSKDHSGWLLVANSRRQDEEPAPAATCQIHAFHLFECLPEIARYLALPPGWAFDVATGKLWFEPEALKDDSGR